MDQLRNHEKSVGVGIIALLSILPFGSVGLAQTQMQMALGGVTGTYYMIGVPVAKYVNEHSKMLKVTPNTSGGSVENIRRVDAGLAQLGMIQTDVMYPAWQTKGTLMKSMTLEISIPSFGSTSPRPRRRRRCVSQSQPSPPPNHD